MGLAFKHTPNLTPSAQPGVLPQPLPKSFAQVRRQESGHLLHTSPGLPIWAGARPKPSGRPTGASARGPWVTLRSLQLSQNNQVGSPRGFHACRSLFPEAFPPLPGSGGSGGAQVAQAAQAACLVTVCRTAAAGSSPDPLNSVLIIELVIHVIVGY